MIQKARRKITLPTPRALKVQGLGPIQIAVLVKDAGIAWNTDGAASMGAALAFYTIFSIAPLLIITLAIAGFVFGAEAAQGQIYAQARSILGSDGASALEGLVRSASQPKDGFAATLVGLIFMLIGATGVFAELQGAMDRIWQTPVAKEQTGLWYLIRRRIVTFGMLLAIAFLLLVSLAVSALISALQSLWRTPADGLVVTWQAINFAVGLIMVAALFALMFKMLPRVSVAWGDVLIGAGFTALLFEFGKYLISFYIGETGVVSGFGVAGSVIAMLLWVYYSAQIFLLGAEFTWIYAKRYGSRKATETTPLKQVDSPSN